MTEPADDTRRDQEDAERLEAAGWLVMRPDTVARILAKDDQVAAFLRGYMGIKQPAEDLSAS